MSFNWLGRKPKKVKCNICGQKVSPTVADEIAFESINEDGTTEKIVAGHLCNDCADKLDEIEKRDPIFPMDD